MSEVHNQQREDAYQFKNSEKNSTSNTKKKQCFLQDFTYQMITQNLKRKERERGKSRERMRESFRLLTLLLFEIKELRYHLIQLVKRPKCPQIPNFSFNALRGKTVILLKMPPINKRVPILVKLKIHIN